MFVGKSAYLYIGGITRVTVIIGGKCEVGKRFRKKKKRMKRSIGVKRVQRSIKRASI